MAYRSRRADMAGCAGRHPTIEQYNTMAHKRLTMGQALVRFLENQYISYDGVEQRFVEGVFAIFGHGNVAGLGEALVSPECGLVLRQGKNEQGMAHAAIAFAKQHKRRKIYAVTSSIGPGAMNMVTAAATATVNRIPALFLPGDIFACRQPDPVLQQIEHFHDGSLSVNDSFRPVSVYFSRIERPEQLMQSMIQAMRALTTPATPGAATIALPQDVQAESYDYPDEFFEKRIHYYERTPLSEEALDRAVRALKQSSRPVMVCGGGVRYSDAGDTMASLCSEHSIPFVETQAGKGTIRWDHPMNLGGAGVTGTLAANKALRRADLLIAVGTRLGDFTTASKTAIPLSCKVLSINIAPFDAYKMNAYPLVSDARTALRQIGATTPQRLRRDYVAEIDAIQNEWREEVDTLGAAVNTKSGELSQSAVLYALNNTLLDPNDIVISASGSLPGDMQRIWRAHTPDSYHMEYGFSCMGYEVSGALGIQLAEPNRGVYCVVGDGAYAMLHSELITAVQEQIPITVLLFDNCGYQVIDNLQTNCGIPSYANEWRHRNSHGRLEGRYLAIDWAKQAEAYGVTSFTVTSIEDLKRSINEARKIPGPRLLDIKVAKKSMTHGYGSFWRVGVPDTSIYDSVHTVHQQQVEARNSMRQF